MGRQDQQERCYSDKGRSGRCRDALLSNLGRGLRVACIAQDTAAFMMDCSVASPRSRSAVTRPSCMTRMRSARRRTSGNSEEITITATPLSARSAMILCTRKVRLRKEKLAHRRIYWERKK